MTRGEAVLILSNTYVNLGRKNGKTTYAEALQMAINTLEQPERKKGQWIEDNTRMSGPYYVCDQCGSEYKTPDNFCGNCGAMLEV